MEQPLQLSAGNGNAATHTRYRIEDRSYLSIIKKEIARSAESLGFAPERIGRLDIIVSELLSNLLKFGVKKRELLWKPLLQGGRGAIEILAIDGGSGIANTSRALEDGYSTSGTAGQGLGAIRRLSDFFDLYSQPGLGTIVLVRLFAEEYPLAEQQLASAGVISVAKSGEKVCGDGYQLDYDPEEKQLRLLVVDGLGHGPEAHLAANAALDVFAAEGGDDQSLLLKQIHQSIKRTRGVVALSATYKGEEHQLHYCGVGNISGRLLGFEGTKVLTSFNGIVGHAISSRIHDQRLAWERGKLLVLHSDGLLSRWDMGRYPQVQKHDPSLIAACLYRDYNRGTDDITILVSKHPD
ncbi:SpoIIE family protein phosphatase [Cesiribacter andamanensis]|uniref:Serine/threonine-protein kinase rsbT n=1 Tax=Cesiribacter andamanensis AMV16 TaxID=1279009 RepID=M7N2P4_9BACT|nr:SpoIIE family protein phosphatase [Cesiribacter andamanensis]EMR01491.1 Serine/threonine-protein kinase rsbT [Cesiribacter andamanensis AMV16]